MDEQDPWEQMVGEPSLWYGRFAAYLRLGSKRSVAAIYRKEHPVKPRQTPLKIDGDWYDIEKEWKWKERAKAYDDHVRAEEDRIIAEEREKVIRHGYALMHKRVQELDKLTRKLVGYTRDEKNIWLPDVKSIQMGLDIYERIDLVHFNAPLFTVISKYFADIAAELGERVKKQELTGKDGGPIDFVTEWGGGSIEEDEEG